MFVYKRTIHIQETDVTGVIYFAILLKIGLEAFEEFMSARGFLFKKRIHSKKFLLPIVHAETDYERLNFVFITLLTIAMIFIAEEVIIIF